MAWESRNGKGSYYTRSRKVGGRVVREYLGAGEAAQTIAALDACEREARARERCAEQALRQEQEQRDAMLAEFCEAADQWGRVALIAAGYHRHDRGEWRRKREQD